MAVLEFERPLTSGGSFLGVEVRALKVDRWLASTGNTLSSAVIVSSNTTAMTVTTPATIVTSNTAQFTCTAALADFEGTVRVYVKCTDSGGQKKRYKIDVPIRKYDDE
ncbi:MAG: hypothetical protein GY896_11720 [Gammaproteobacteria bacterium]|nr:hypothetical protein [Gammaproteobacteria bacterium]